MSNPIKSRLLSTAATAEYLGISRQTIYNGIGPKAKRPFPIKPVRIAGKVLFDVLDLDAFIDRQKSKSISE